MLVTSLAPKSERFIESNDQKPYHANKNLFPIFLF